MDTIRKIGKPALLELAAEEATELAHACLKMARKLRDENPTPMDEKEIKDKVAEEVADVYLCVDRVLYELGISAGQILEIEAEKKKRWRERIKEMEKRNEQSRNEKSSEE